MRIRTLLTIPLIAAASLMGCSSDAPTEPAPTGGGPTEPAGRTDSVRFDVQWQPNARVLDENVMSSVQSIDSLRKTFRFATGIPSVDSIRAGDVIVFGNYTLRKVRTVSVNSGVKTIYTDTCAITDAIRDGDIAWDLGIRFDPAHVRPHPQFGKAVRGSAPDTFGVQFERGDYEYAVGIKLLGDRMNIDIRALKKIHDAKVVELRAHGVIYRNRALGRVMIRNGRLMEFDARNDFSAGDLTLSINSAGSGDDLGIEFELPLLVIPIPQAPIFTFEAKTVFVINAVVPVDGSCLMKARFKYDADGGFKYVDGQNVQSIAQLRGDKVTKEGEPRTGASTPVGFNWGVGLPKLEVKLLGTPIAWVQNGFLIGGDFTPFFPPCQQARARFIGAAGYGIGAFGFTLASGSRTLWDKETVFLKTGQCP